MNDKADYKGRCGNCGSDKVEIVEFTILSPTLREIQKYCYSCGSTLLGYQVLIPPENEEEQWIKQTNN
ncbi:hypothetical protein [Gloeothece verrucosa]|uniref:Uncharacterized protein n=1 Tax=Gloeothece verrucosa (strain PCC 7822) TaxID=497965 RepID=E0U8Q2_GLOV7|nr:hypothetical protein [Gloeothece verrucosa]ADN14916.1 hypothetical protein Cyan7822_2959 [Gloeothece verrucosa PCC 7822]